MNKNIMTHDTTTVTRILVLCSTVQRPHVTVTSKLVENIFSGRTVFLRTFNPSRKACNAFSNAFVAVTSIHTLYLISSLFRTSFVKNRPSLAVIRATICSAPRCLSYPSFVHVNKKTNDGLKIV